MDSRLQKLAEDMAVERNITLPEARDRFLDAAPGSAFNLRMPKAIRQQLDLAAAQNNRSLNGEIVHRLKQSLEGYWR